MPTVICGVRVSPYIGAGRCTTLENVLDVEDAPKSRNTLHQILLAHPIPAELVYDRREPASLL